MDGIDIVNELNACIEQALQARQNWDKDMQRANALEAEYRKQKSVAIMQARADKLPATVIDAVVSGWDNVNTARMNWKNAQSVADSSKELVMLLKKKMSILQDFAQNEWQRSRVL